MSAKPHFIPRPLVQTNQTVIVLSVLAVWFSHHSFYLLIPLLAGLCGLLTGFNPIMRTAKLFLNKPLASYIPEDPAQQQFNQIIAVICLGAGWGSFILGWNAAGYIFTAMVFLAAFVALLGFCVGCFIRFQWQQYRHKRKKAYHS